MNIRPDITEFIVELEVFGKRKLNYPLEVSEILQIAVQTGMVKEFEELIFQAKFLTRTQDVMKQIGLEAQGFEKLSTEFQSGIKKSMDLLKMLVGRAGKDVIQKYLDDFFTMETEGFARLMKLNSDLSWIKNWQIDGKSMPYETASSKKSTTQEHANLQTKEERQQQKSTKSFSSIQRSAVLAAILFVLFILIDPPVTILGWMLSLGIAALLAYIVIEISFLTKYSNSDRIDFK